MDDRKAYVILIVLIVNMVLPLIGEPSYMDKWSAIIGWFGVIGLYLKSDTWESR